MCRQPPSTWAQSLVAVLLNPNPPLWVSECSAPDIITGYPVHPAPGFHPQLMEKTHLVNVMAYLFHRRRPCSGTAVFRGDRNPEPPTLQPGYLVYWKRPPHKLPPAWLEGPPGRTCARTPVPLNSGSRLLHARVTPREATQLQLELHTVW